MKKLIAPLVVVAFTATSGAQMPLPLVDNKAPATKSAPVPAKPTMLLPTDQAKTATSQTDKINKQAAALQAQIDKLWAATGGKLTQQVNECPKSVK